MLTAEDRCAISETISLHGHLFDEGDLDRLDELFTADVVYDVTDVGMKPLHGIDEIRRATLELGAANPVAHHVTNIIITSVAGTCVKGALQSHRGEERRQLRERHLRRHAAPRRRPMAS